MGLERIPYTIRGAVSYALDLSNLQRRGNSGESPYKYRGVPHIVFTFWDAPEYVETTKLMSELRYRFRGEGLPIGAGLFTRPMGDVLAGRDYAYDPRKLNMFLKAAADTRTPVFIITSGMHWSEVSYKQSPLLRMLEKGDDRVMKFEDGSRVPRKLQPPGNYLRGYFGSDKNGVLYLSHDSPGVKLYRERNLRQMADAVTEFTRRHPNLFLGISTENEVDYPGEWITGGKKVDDGADGAYRQRTVMRVLRRNVEILLDAGIPKAKIFTNQSVEDGINRASPLATADIADSNIGITTWRTGNFDLYRQARNLAWERGKRWALVLTNPLSLNARVNADELRAAIAYYPDIIGLYNWWPHFWGYSIRGMPLAKAVETFTR